MSRFLYPLLVLTLALASGCGFVPEKVSISDPRLAPMFQAIAAVDRASLGFTPIPGNADIRLEGRSGTNYDAMLHVYAKTSRTIAFRKTETGYKWIHEQEIYNGPKTYSTPDGVLKEQIIITYGTERVSGNTPNKLTVQYSGEDTRLTNHADLTLVDVRPILMEWHQK